LPAAIARKPGSGLTLADLGCESWQVNGKAVKTHFVLMQAIGKGRRQDKDREHRWVKLEEAKAITVT
jgi:hypothetical protein